MTNYKLVVQNANDDYSSFQLEQEGWGIVARVHSQSDDPRFPFVLAAAPELLAVCRDVLAKLNARPDRWQVFARDRADLHAVIAKATGEAVQP